MMSYAYKSPSQTTTLNAGTTSQSAQTGSFGYPSVAASNSDAIAQLEQMTQGASQWGPSCDVEQGGEFEAAYESDEHVRIGDGAGTELVMVNGVEMTMGQINALADYYGSPEEMLEVDPCRLRMALELLERETAQPGSVTVDEWQEATENRYLELSKANDDHFAPSNPDLCAPSGDGGRNHADTWEGHYTAALGLAGEAKDEPDKYNEALLHCGFAEHYLVDAFSAGHLFNKGDVMARTESRVNELWIWEKSALLQRIADGVFPASAEIISEYQMGVEAEIPGPPGSIGMWTDIDSPGEFGLLLKAGYLTDNDLLHNGVVKAAHDFLNDHEGGVAVANDLHPEGWRMSGDGTLDTEHGVITKQYCEEALQVGRWNLEAARSAGYWRVSWIDEMQGLFPRVTEESAALIAETIERMSDPSGDLVPSVTAVVNKSIRDIMEELVREGGGVIRRNPALGPIDGEAYGPDRDVPAP
jgi:hypothetical protein